MAPTGPITSWQILLEIKARELEIGRVGALAHVVVSPLGSAIP